MRPQRRRKRAQFILTAPRQIALEQLKLADRPLRVDELTPGNPNASRTARVIVKFGWAEMLFGPRYVITDQGRKMVP